MKHLKKHPKQQRMEDMTFPLVKPSRKALRSHKMYQKALDRCAGGSVTFPLQKFDPNPKSLGFAVAVRKLLDEGTKPEKDMTFPITKPLTSNGRDVCVGDLKKDEEYEAYWDGNNWILKEKVTMTGREWLRSINDDNGFTLMPRIVWRLVAVGVLVGAVTYFLSKVL